MIELMFRVESKIFSLGKSRSMPRLKVENYQTNLTTWVKNELRRAKNLSDISDIFNFLNAGQIYHTMHLGICSLDGLPVRDTIYTYSNPSPTFSLEHVTDDLIWTICEEAEHLLRPFDLLTHEFETANTGLFDDIRRLAVIAGLKQLMVIPMKVEKTTSLMVVHFPLGDFESHASEVLPWIYQFIVALFERFPKILLWPNTGKLTRRENEMLTLSARGFTEAAIAEKCGISINTVRNHVENSKVKLNARNKLHAVMIAAETHEIDLPLRNLAPG